MAQIRRSVVNSASSPKNTTVKSPLLFHRPNLGDKLHHLALRSPRHLKAVEVYVDVILARLNSEARLKTRTRWIALVLICPFPLI